MIIQSQSTISAIRSELAKVVDAISELNGLLSRNDDGKEKAYMLSEKAIVKEVAMSSPKFDRMTRLATIPDDDDWIDPELENVGLRYDQSRKLAEHEAAARAPIAALLVAEVERCWDSYQAACRDLQLWRLSHGEEKPS